MLLGRLNLCDSQLDPSTRRESIEILLTTGQYLHLHHLITTITHKMLRQI